MKVSLSSRDYDKGFCWVVGSGSCCCWLRKQNNMTPLAQNITQLLTPTSSTCTFLVTLYGCLQLD